MSAISDQLKTASTSWVRLIPMTFIDDKTRSFTTAVFRSLAGNYTATGDVFNTGFFQHWLSASDVQGALTEGVKPNTAGTFSGLSASVSRVQSVTVGGPSKLYFTKTAAKSFAELRESSFQRPLLSRAKTATEVQNLIDAGAVNAGKMKTSQFADGLVSLDNLMPLSPDMDIAGFLVRDPQPCSIDSWAYGQNCKRRELYAPEAPTGFIIGRVSNIAGVPDVVFLLGQASYQSTLMLKTEFLPLTVDIMAAKGCDGRLLELAAALKKAGILKTPKTGSLALLKKGPGIIEFGPDNRKKRANV
ncbi:uncharacterized protein RCO7_10515 [Rhynchosporium graminicola]|uniref:Uncharacterized protein n=1 Tax=Rhynchosporium graminicola TaxID=2792576 RepID=A0A1E1LIY5_9HELO|nr:uncharacterized protein RCO7_10515 [Rhynchosporium commune]